MSIDALCGLNLLKYEDIPFFVFGHELGALVAFELCRRLNTEFPASALFVSGMSCPQVCGRSRYWALVGLPGQAAE